MQGIEITRAKFAQSDEEYPNSFILDITNGFINNLNMIMSFENIFDYGDGRQSKAIHSKSILTAEFFILEFANGQNFMLFPKFISSFQYIYCFW